LSGGFAEGVTRCLNYDPFEDSDQAEDCDYLSDSDLEDEVEVAEPTTKVHIPAIETKCPSVTGEFRNELSNQGKVVVLRDISYLTSVRAPFLSL
jgi:hypothetical protein